MGVGTEYLINSGYVPSLPSVRYDVVNHAVIDDVGNDDVQKVRSRLRPDEAAHIEEAEQRVNKCGGCREGQAVGRDTLRLLPFLLPQQTDGQAAADAEDVGNRRCQQEYREDEG